MSSLRMLVCDLDGSLLDPSQQLTDAGRLAVAALRRAGIEVVLASGRIPTAMRRVCRDLGLDGPQIAMHGGFIGSPLSGEVLAAYPLDSEAVRAHLDFAERLQVPAILCYPDGFKTLTRALPADLTQFFRPFDEPLPEVVPDPELLVTTQPIKTFLHTGAARYAEVRAAAQHNFGHRFTITSANERSVELLGADVDKAAAARLLARRSGLTMREVAAIGDGPNDIELLRAAGASAAMGQANPEVKAAACFIARSNAEDGAADAIAHFFPDAIGTPLPAAAGDGGR
ncbi:MAG TPA: HAD family hydrolase [Candidatus Sulfotelmatobacter sp.]|nr:HAD family hydrolase [Candidatus Sulfotelmatobacter sp.]